MSFKVERYFSKNGYKYSSNSNYVAYANYTFGLLLRKIKVYGPDGLLYTLRQENILLKAALNIVRLFYRPEDVPEYILYYDKKCIGKTVKFRDSKLNININDTVLTLKTVKSDREKKHIIHIMNKDRVVLIIKKDRLRYGKKNVYDVVCDNWTYDEGLMLLLIAFCDVVFFPEWFRWSAIEYDLV